MGKKYKLTFTLKDGSKDSVVFEVPEGPKGDKGDDYVLTPADKEEIAEMAAEMVDVPGSGGNVDYGAENAGKLLYVGADGFATVLALGAGLAIVDGVLIITSQVVTSAVCGQAVCGNAICGGA